MFSESFIKDGCRWKSDASCVVKGYHFGSKRNFSAHSLRKKNKGPTHVPRSGMRINASSGSCGLVVFRDGRGIALFRDKGEGRYQEPKHGVWNIVSSWKAEGNRLTSELQSLGLAGFGAYGILNCLYYTIMFMFVWTQVAQVPTGLGISATLKKFLEVMGIVWAGSQITKIPRLAGALALAPLMDKGLEAGAQKLQVGSKKKAFVALVLVCLGLSLLIFGATIVLWA